MHSPDTCSSMCSCACPACHLAGDHPRHAGPLTVLANERDPIDDRLVDELLPAGARVESFPTPARCCDWSSGHHPGSPVDELEHGAARVCPACGLLPAAPGDRYCAGCGSAPDRSAWAVVR